MAALDLHPGTPLDDLLRRAVGAWRERHGVSARRFGVEVLGDPGFVLSQERSCATSTVHAFQGRTVDTVIAAMEANHPHLTTQKSFYVEISRARDRAELVTDDRAALKEQLEMATGERIAALEAVEPDRAKDRAAGLDADRSADRGTGASGSREREGASSPELEPSRAPKGVDREFAP